MSDETFKSCAVTTPDLTNGTVTSSIPFECFFNFNERTFIMMSNTDSFTPSIVLYS